MKKQALIIIGILLALILVSVVVFMLLTQKISLSAEYYHNDGLETIDLAKVQELVADQKSFGLFVSQPACRTSEDLQKILETFSAEYHIKFFETDFSDLKDSGLVDGLKFYPSFVILIAARQ